MDCLGLSSLPVRSEGLSTSKSESQSAGPREDSEARAAAGARSEAGRACEELWVGTWVALVLRSRGKREERVARRAEGWGC